MRVTTTDRVFARNTGGNTTYARYLYKNLQEQGVKHHLAVLPTVFPKASRAGAYAALEGLLLPHSKPADADLVHYPADTGPLARHRDVPGVVTIHGIASLHIRAVRSDRQEKIWRARVSRAAEVCDGIITVSESSARDLHGFLGVAASKLHVIPHGLDPARFRPDEAASASVAATYGLPARFALFVGNLDPRKNIRQLLRIFSQNTRLLAEGVPLVVAGGPAWTDGHVVEDLSAADNIIYLGQIPDADVAPLMGAATVFVFPSRYEGFGFPVLEAMACGTPVVTTKAGSLAEVAGDAAITVAVDDDDDLVSAVLQVLADASVAEELVARGLERVTSYTWEASAARHLLVMSSIADSRRR